MRKRRIIDILKVLFLFLDDFAALLLLLLILSLLGVKITWQLIVGLTVAFLGLAFVIHWSIIPTFHQRQVTGVEGMVGQTGRAIEPLTPTGLVRVKDELWKAKSVAGNIESGEEVEVLRVVDLTLEVRRKV